MEQRNLGRSGLIVSLAGLGCNAFGRACDESETRAVVHAALDQGVRFFDTADHYGNRGLSEEYLGKALAGCRADVILATKFALPMGEGPLLRGGSRRYVLRAIEASLRRLGSEWIDLYQVHFPDAQTPIEETLRALDDVVRAGQVRYVGCSNFAGWQLVEAQWTARSANLTPFASAQNAWSLLDRRIERELVPAARAYGVGILPYFPLGSGLLSGKYRRGEPPPAGSRFAGQTPGSGFLSERNFDVVEKVRAFAAECGRSTVELALGWLAARPEVASVISGARRPEQVAENARAAGTKLAPEELARLDEITRPAR